jgi:hypothetical protein
LAIGVLVGYFPKGFAFQDDSVVSWISVFEAENSFFDMEMPP